MLQILCQKILMNTILTICNIKSRRIDFSGLMGSLFSNTRKNFSNHLYDSVLSKNGLSF